MNKDIQEFNRKNAEALAWLDNELEMDFIHETGEVINRLPNVLNPEDKVRQLAMLGVALQNNILAVAALYSKGGAEAVYDDVDAINNVFECIEQVKTGLKDMCPEA